MAAFWMEELDKFLEQSNRSVETVLMETQPYFVTYELPRDVWNNYHSGEIKKNNNKYST